MTLGDQISKVLVSEILKNQIMDYFRREYSLKDEEDDAVLIIPVNPLTILNLPYDIPALSNIVEIVPYVKEINSVSGTITVGWNFFIEGIHRFDLGTTKFEDFNNMISALRGGGFGYQSNVKPQMIVKDLIKFIFEILKKHKVDIDISAKKVDKTFFSHKGDKFIRSIGTPGAMGRMYTQNRFAN